MTIRVPNLKNLGRILVALVLGVALWLAHPTAAQARRGGGRVGGGSFRAPARTIRPSSPMVRTNTYYTPAPVFSPFGGGFFFFPSFFGGGSLLTLLVVVAIAGVVLQAFRNSGIGQPSDKVTIAQVKVGLLASARSLQQDLTELAYRANTDSATGLAQALREATVSLLRHPEYWAYVSSGKAIAPFAEAEQAFQGMVVSERAKLGPEVLTNGRALGTAAWITTPDTTTDEDPSEYIVVTLVVAATGTSLQGLPAKIREAEQLRQTLTQVGSVPTDNLLAMEVLWEPQSLEYTLSADEVVATYPELVRL
ncbi:MAG TPA: hypothetical protein DCQ32_04970 [Cyanobacteria bacterium UBA8156]|jgi:uncharacterized membrane protein|nr:hypothetical protein [Cyanobacteria bacterium UBA8156]